MVILLSCCRRQRNSNQEVNQRVKRHKQQRAIALVEPKHHESVDSAIYDVIIDYDQINSQPPNLESFQTDTYNSLRNLPESLYLTPRLTRNQPDNYTRLDVAAANRVNNVSNLVPDEAPHSPPPAYTPFPFSSRSVT